MCVIVIKTKETKLSKDDIRGMLAANQDGVGFAIFEKDCIRVEKYFTKDDELLTNYLYHRFLDRSGVIHFRLTTSGHTIPEMCHPYWVDSKNQRFSSLKIQKNDERFLLFHNGVMNSVLDKHHEKLMRDKVINDTMGVCSMVAKEYGADTSIEEMKEIFKQIGKATSSKFCIIHKGAVHPIGNFEKTKSGLICSNLRWKSYTDDGWWNSRAYRGSKKSSRTYRDSWYLRGVDKADDTRDYGPEEYRRYGTWV